MNPSPTRNFREGRGLTVTMKKLGDESITFFGNILRLASRTVINTAKKSHPAGGSASVARGKNAPARFWIRHANRELNRTGDFILKNLRGIRKEAASRSGVA